MIRKFIFILVISVGCLFTACSEKVAPAKATAEKPGNFDVAAFDRFYVEGLKQKLMGSGGEALKYFEQCLKLNPVSDAVYYQMAQILGSTGDFSNAKKYASKAHKYGPDNIWYLMLLSQMHYQEKDLDSAVIWYEKAAKLIPEDDNISMTLGNLYVEAGDYEKANAIFDGLDKKYGVNETSTITSARILMSSGKYEEAAVKVEELLKQNPEDILFNGLMAEILSGKGDKAGALQVYEKLRQSNPTDPQVQLSFAEFLTAEKKYDELFSLLNVIALNENVRREDKVKVFAELAQNPDIVGDKENRLTMALLVLEASYVEDEIIPLLRADLMIRQGKVQQGIIRLEELIKKRPENYFAWEKLLLAYFDRGDFSRLYIKAEECASRFNMSILAKVLYATAAIETGKFDVAENELKKAEILAGDNKEYKMQVLTMRADLFYRKKEYGKAFETYEEALKNNGDDLTVMNNYAYYLAEQNVNLKEAEELAKRVVDKEKTNTTFLDTYGWVLYKRGKLGDAARVFETIINSGEIPDAEWFEHYGYILSKQKKCTKAVEQWKLALDLDPSKTHLLEEIENCEK